MSFLNENESYVKGKLTYHLVNLFSDLKIEADDMIKEYVECMMLSINTKIKPVKKTAGEAL